MPFENPEDMGAFRTLVMADASQKMFCQVSAASCGPCQLIKDDMEALSNDPSESYKFVYIDVDKMEGF